MYTSDRAKRYTKRKQKRRQIQFAKPSPKEDTFSIALAARKPLRVAHSNRKMVGSDDESPRNRIDRTKRRDNDSAQNISNDLARGSNK